MLTNDRSTLHTYGTMDAMTTNEIIHRAWKHGTVVPAFNIPYLPMMAAVVRALRDTGSFGLIAVARLEWVKFEAGSLAAVHTEYQRVKDERHTRLHLDHVPVIDEDGERVDFAGDIQRAITVGFQSVMVDGSRVPFDQNVACTRQVVEHAHAHDVPVEAELGAVLGHEAGPMPSYDELFASGRGFTDPAEARRFVQATGVDWLSVAIGNVHGAIAATQRDKQKITARLNLDHLAAINRAAHVPLVLHGGTGIRPEDIRAALAHGIAKINVATAIRQPYERALPESLDAARQAVYEATCHVLTEELQIENSASLYQ
jgi:fructose-bisphosphate aldolase class II